MKLQVLILAVAFFISSSADTAAQKYCGRRLAITIAAICESVAPNGNKRALSYNSLDYDYAWPWLAPQDARAMGRGKRFSGVVAECCEKACTVSELMAYC